MVIMSEVEDVLCRWYSVYSCAIWSDDFFVFLPSNGESSVASDEGCIGLLGVAKGATSLKLGSEELVVDCVESHLLVLRSEDLASAQRPVRSIISHRPHPPSQGHCQPCRSSVVLIIMMECQLEA